VVDVELAAVRFAAAGDKNQWQKSGHDQASQQNMIRVVQSRLSQHAE
jgi:hypothetical protein